MEVRTGSIGFSRARDTGPRKDRVFFNFPTPVKQAVAGIQGTQFGFSPRDDHHLGKVSIILDTSISADVVTVEATFGVRDWSDNFDDDYEGTVYFAVIAET